MSGHHHRSHQSNQSHARRHHRHKAQVAGAAVAGAGIGAAAAPFMSERAGQLTEEALAHVPKPMLAGLAIGVMVGAPVGYLWRDRQEPEAGSYVDQVTKQRDVTASTSPTR